jgi:hypothetical protein
VGWKAIVHRFSRGPGNRAGWKARCASA